MSRLVFFVVVFVVVYWLFRSWRGQSSRHQGMAAPPPVENMVRCAQCGVHLPVSESVLSKGRYYCSEAHRLTHNAQSE